MIIVLSMVVVGGLVGGQALGYDVVAGFSQAHLFGLGLAAGFALVLLGVMLDRMTHGAAAARLATPALMPRRGVPPRAPVVDNPRTGPGSPDRQRRSRTRWL